MGWIKLAKGDLAVVIPYIDGEQWEFGEQALGYGKASSTGTFGIARR